MSEAKTREEALEHERRVELYIADLLRGMQRANFRSSGHSFFSDAAQHRLRILIV
jgi:hypothetical protein